MTVVTTKCPEGLLTKIDLSARFLMVHQVPFSSYKNVRRERPCKLSVLVLD